MDRRNEAKRYVLSFRVNEEEWRLLQDALKKSGRDVSTLLRQSFNAVVRQARTD